jgi:hypothetical protein
MFPNRAPTKRPSDFSVSSESSPFLKKLKTELASDKENISLQGSNTKIKGKEKVKPFNRVCSSSDDDAPWNQMELDPQGDPWVRLERDYPHLSHPTPAKIPPSNNEKYSDLTSVSPYLITSLYSQKGALIRNPSLR